MTFSGSYAGMGTGRLAICVDYFCLADQGPGSFHFLMYVIAWLAGPAVTIETVCCALHAFSIKPLQNNRMASSLTIMAKLAHFLIWGWPVYEAGSHL